MSLVHGAAPCSGFILLKMLRLEYIDPRFWDLFSSLSVPDFVSSTQTEYTTLYFSLYIPLFLSLIYLFIFFITALTRRPRAHHIRNELVDMHSDRNPIQLIQTANTSLEVKICNAL